MIFAWFSFSLSFSVTIALCILFIRGARFYRSIFIAPFHYDLMMMAFLRNKILGFFIKLFSRQEVKRVQWCPMHFQWTRIIKNCTLKVEIWFCNGEKVFLIERLVGYKIELKSAEKVSSSYNHYWYLFLACIANLFSSIFWYFMDMCNEKCNRIKKTHLKCSNSQMFTWIITWNQWKNNKSFSCRRILALFVD